MAKTTQKEAAEAASKDEPAAAPAPAPVVVDPLTVTATADFFIGHRGVMIMFKQGQPKVVDAELLALLKASNSPI